MTKNETPQQIQEALELATHELVDAIDRAGLGPKAIDAIGQDNFRTLMDGYRAHERRTGK
jgi:hypothetical protein